MKYEIRKICGLNCVIRYPKGYIEQKKYPVILFLHGAGSRGEDTTALEKNPYFLITEKHLDFPFITVAPLCIKDTWFELMDDLSKIIHEIEESDFVDVDRMYAVGASMGGYAVWQLAMNLPYVFAAIIPICGGGMYWNARRLVGTAIWAFHGDSDDVVFAEESVKMVEKVNAAGGDAKLTIYENTGHDSWSETYSNYKVFRWLIEQKNTYVDDLRLLNGVDVYG